MNTEDAEHKISLAEGTKPKRLQHTSHGKPHARDSKAASSRSTGRTKRRRRPTIRRSWPFTGARRGQRAATRRLQEGYDVHGRRHRGPNRQGFPLDTTCCVLHEVRSLPEQHPDRCPHTRHASTTPSSRSWPPANTRAFGSPANQQSSHLPGPPPRYPRSCTRRASVPMLMRVGTAAAHRSSCRTGTTPRPARDAGRSRHGTPSPPWVCPAATNAETARAGSGQPRDTRRELPAEVPEASPPGLDRAPRPRCVPQSQPTSRIRRLPLHAALPHTDHHALTPPPWRPPPPGEIPAAQGRESAQGTVPASHRKGYQRRSPRPPQATGALPTTGRRHTCVGERQAPARAVAESSRPAQQTKVNGGREIRRRAAGGGGGGEGG
jgi:hypothetical protein